MSPSPLSPAPISLAVSPTGPTPTSTTPTRTAPRTLPIPSSTSPTTTHSLPPAPSMTTPPSVSSTVSLHLSPSSAPNGGSSNSASSFNAMTRKSKPKSARQRRNALAQMHREPLKSSVDIQPEWNMLDQIPFSTFSKLSFSVPEPEDLLLCGALEFYDQSFDRITPKNEHRLECFKNRNFFKVTTTDDPVICCLASEDKATIFATDTILSTLMCAPRSVYSWDIVVQRVRNKLFFDKRDGSQLDLLSAHETSQRRLC
ncbi:hypothetical protein SO802_032535 [Lithocarpus litseifolius]|uniref:Eukaryotic translation initiation factor 3 subunit D n=1 Tax=Lithocarpus litseifolius TaxID=425828 RepID=A0AAW2BFX5_9ROSI